MTGALGNQTTFDYDAVGRRTSIVDPNGNVPGETDFTAQLGTVTSWLVDEDGWSVLEGSWGTARVFRPMVTLIFESPD